MNLPQPDFDNLRRLLALKRYEQPPPGFFSHFSDRVIARIEAEEMTTPAPGWRRWLAALDFRPSLAGAYGLLVVGLIVAGVGLSRSLEPVPAMPTFASGMWAGTPLQNDSEMAAPAAVTVQVAGRRDAASSVAPVLGVAPHHPVFDPRRLRVQQVSYTPAQP
jgi:hypothetical protein